MEKQYKPVPDVECLKYHGTPEKPDIKIFVSHRIDQDSETIDNPLYIPVRCGAMYDEREGVTMLGDDTGENISEKQKRLGELTVLYWAWKNIKADYYGLCHYRRYLMYSKKRYEVAKDANNTIGLVYSPNIQTAKRIGHINNEMVMRQKIQGSKILMLEPYDLKNNGIDNIQSNINLDVTNYDRTALTTMLSIIKRKYPELFPAAQKYLNQSKANYYNLFVMEASIFDEYCSFLFDVLFTLEKKLNFEHYNPEKQRIMGYLGELLFGIFVSAKYKTKCDYLQGTFIAQLHDFQPLIPAYPQNNVAVVFSSSDFFVPYLGVALSSLMQHTTKDFNYDIIVLEKSISKQNKAKLEHLVESVPNFSLRFVDVKGYIYNTNFYLPADNPELSEETYYTIIVPWVLANYRKALVLDCDIIVRRNVAELYQMDLGECYLGAAKEYLYQGFLNNPNINVKGSLSKYCHETLKMEDEYDYYNAGVLLLDLEAFRRHFSLDSLLTQISKTKFSIVEQDLLNKICCGHILNIGYEWNFMACLSSETIPQIKLVSAVEQTYYKKAMENIGILHYITLDKPWKYPELKYADLWWEECKKTEFYEICLYRMADNAARKAVQRVEPAIYDLQRFAGFLPLPPDSRSGARKLADKILPPGTRRREFAKKLLPKGSLRWRFCKQVYYIFRPQYRPKKVEEEDMED